MSFMYPFFIPEETKMDEGMSACLFSDPMVNNLGPDGLVNKIPGQVEVDFAMCDCCELTEECTPSYIETIRERYGGKWICGLCEEAVKDEILRCQKPISPDEAMARHLSFCSKLRASDPPQDPTVHLIRALRRLLTKGLGSPKCLRSMPNSPITYRGNLNIKDTMMSQSESCIPDLARVQTSTYCGVEEAC